MKQVSKALGNTFCNYKPGQGLVSTTQLIQWLFLSACVLRAVHVKISDRECVLTHPPSLFI